MTRTKTLRRRKHLSQNTKKNTKRASFTPITLKTKEGLAKIDPSKIMLHKTFLITALLECFEDNDPEAFLEILDGYIIAHNKTAFAKKAAISRSTLYDMLHGRKNPTLRVLTQCIHELVS